MEAESIGIEVRDARRQLVASIRKALFAAARPYRRIQRSCKNADRLHGNHAALQESNGPPRRCF